MPIKLLIICHESLCCHALKNLFDRENDFHVMGCFGVLDEAMNYAKTNSPGIIMICANFLTKEGTECIPRIRRVLGQSKLVIFNSALSGAQELLMVQDGVVGVFDNGMSPSTFPPALRKIHTGECWLRRELISMLVDGDRTEPANDCMIPLTNREKQILSLIVAGHKNKEIASQLFVSEMTIKTHINNIFRKLNIKNRNEAILYAVKCNHTLQSHVKDN